MDLCDVYIVAATRTAIGKAKGAFRHTRPDDLLAHVLRALMAQSPALLSEIEDVIIGCAMPEAEQGMNVARIGALLAGFPDQIPGMTVNRFCASGLETISVAQDRIAAGKAELIIAGGVESMSFVPLGGHHYAANPAYFADNTRHRGMAYGMGLTAEKVARQWGVSREAQDQFACQSHERALEGIARGEFLAEITPITVKSDQLDLSSGEIKHDTAVITQDQGPRPESNLATLATLRPVFAARGTVTAGNSSQMSDGAAALLLASAQAVKKYNLQPIARLRSYAVAGVAPEHMGIGPIVAIPKALQASALTMEDLDWIELNEAFAAQSLAVINTLKLDPQKVNPLGGAIALGHPLGATGAILATKLIYGLRRRKLKYGMVTMCIGTGMGAAGIFEAL